MDDSRVERIELKKRSSNALEEMKKYEKTIKFHSRRIGKNTIVYCKNKERLDEFESSYKNIKSF